MSAWSSEARAGDDEELQAAIARVEAAKYKEAAQRFASLLDPSGDPCPSEPELTPEGCRLANPELKKRAREHYAVALWAAGGRTQEAREQIEAIVRADPTYQPNPTLFPQPLMDLYVEVRGRLSEEIAQAALRKAEEASKHQAGITARRAAEEAYVRALEKQASEEKIVHTKSRFVAAMPFGAGQFQNGDNGLGVFFGTTQLLASATAIGAFVVWNDLITEAVGRRSTVDSQATKDQTLVAQRVNLVALGVFALSAAAGIVEAQISFDDETVEMRTRPLPKRRPLPPAARIFPTVAPREGGAIVGAVGTF